MWVVTFRGVLDPDLGACDWLVAALVAGLFEGNDLIETGTGGKARRPMASAVITASSTSSTRLLIFLKRKSGARKRLCGSFASRVPTKRPRDSENATQPKLQATRRMPFEMLELCLFCSQFRQPQIAKSLRT